MNRGLHRCDFIVLCKNTVESAPHSDTQSAIESAVKSAVNVTLKVTHCVSESDTGVFLEKCYTRVTFGVQR